VALAVLAIGAPAVRAQGSQLPREDQDAREEWFWAQRAYPGTVRPYDALMRARLDVASRVLARSTLATGIFGGNWRPLGPIGLFDPGSGFFGSGAQLDAGRVAAVAPSPAAGGPFLIGTASGGVWRSTTLGNAWTPVTDEQCSLNTGAVAVDPKNTSIVYAGTGEFNAGSTGCGVLRSVDGGVTWTRFADGLPLGSTAAVRFGSIVVDPATAGSATASVVLGGTNAGVVRSTNSGASWSVVLTGGVSSVIAHPTRAGVFYAGDRDQTTVSHRGVFKSTDAGATWTQLPALPVSTPANVGRIELAISRTSPDWIYALVNDVSTRRLLGLFRYDESKGTWTTLAANGVYTGNARGDFGAQSEYDLAIAVDPRDASRVYVAGVRAFRSTDGGATFRPMANEIHCDWHVIVIDPRNPDILYAGTDGGVFVSTDAGDTWTSKNEGLAITQYYPGISLDPLGTVIMGGSQDNGTHVYSGSLYWDGFLGGDGGYTAINYKDPSIRYGETQWSTGSGNTLVRMSGPAQSTRTNGIASGDRAQFIPPLIIDPITPTRLYFGTLRLYRTTNEGVSWTPVTGDVSKGTGTILTVAVAPSDSNTLYVGTSDGNVQVSQNYGDVFTLSNTGLPNRAITRIVVDPASPTHAVLTVSGFGTGHIFETADAGATWRDISGNLIDAPANSAALVGTSGTIFVGTDVGVFQTSDDGATWTPGPAGLPNVVVQDLVYKPSANLLVAGTYGRGMFAYTVGTQSAVLRGDVNADGKVDALDALMIQQALTASLPGAATIYPRGDANCNGVIDSGDVVLVLRAAVGLSTAGACVGTLK